VPGQQPGLGIGPITVASMVEYAPIDLATKLATFDDRWAPRTVATLNDYDLRVVKVEGEFTRHAHPETDECFLVLSGELTIRFDDGEVALRAGQLYVVPRGTPHQPVALRTAEVMLIEPSATVNTGDTPGSFTAMRREI
jgi:mannose-6-phosphate isomerase-like protein (cupin superfamily)